MNLSSTLDFDIGRKGLTSFCRRGSRLGGRGFFYEETLLSGAYNKSIARADLYQTVIRTLRVKGSDNTSRNYLAEKSSLNPFLN